MAEKLKEKKKISKFPITWVLYSLFKGEHSNKERMLDWVTEIKSGGSDVPQLTEISVGCCLGTHCGNR